MIGQFLLAFREGLEAALVVGIISAYLKRTRRTLLSNYVYYGVYLAIFVSLICGALVWFTYGALVGPSKALFEGIAALLAVLVLTSMVYWMATKGRRLNAEIETRVETLMTRGTTLALVSFSFIIVFREGVETVLFLTPFLLVDPLSTLSGAVLGIMASVFLAYLIFIAGMKINIRRFFYYTSLLLILLAGGLAGYGTHEILEYMEEVGVNTGWLGEPAFDLNVSGDNPLHHKGLIGSVFAVMFGYTVTAEWARIIIHAAYLIIMLPSVFYVYSRQIREG
ncbi:MAG: FTR1 family protein [Candidatus Brockarchaeota archaeon]|nr:FTR1 family protein [Candidatus Brockarchaeota archaeon]MBO3809834.1 FTR1 family protein [Candidatus Brockarchaeota archaeon]